MIPHLPDGATPSQITEHNRRVRVELCTYRAEHALMESCSCGYEGGETQNDRDLLREARQERDHWEREARSWQAAAQEIPNEVRERLERAIADRDHAEQVAERAAQETRELRRRLGLWKDMYYKSNDLRLAAEARLAEPPQGAGD